MTLADILSEAKSIVSGFMFLSAAITAPAISAYLLSNFCSEMYNFNREWKAMAELQREVYDPANEICWANKFRDKIICEEEDYGLR